MWKPLEVEASIPRDCNIDIHGGQKTGFFFCERYPVLVNPSLEVVWDACPHERILHRLEYASLIPWWEKAPRMATASLMVLGYRPGYLPSG
ncbi:hypothetical protein SMACR_02485 [Sordaria macrospora]|uniref:WGS project CABT00000000 data, contig 2.3 n=2 Tax=Sordaria macrospora TaxID=5147 RepID=F7VPQ3_SORMK|nr:uncharacterized protein SMAC_02485 [Sordaria macrospora k-hell]KAA8629749.1 hypothetical protein SMACR_02485 [Sordaria macrospora]KAH7627058.1 hypothetical protein B0T09DRAFT_270440 [Sordaria sp. MPI-SDFR-AT-0083]WPJ64873.1 hypothetical protein SMAC4_02485 [Sordaria macrospora]CCC07481.1 unnamed protein product [Sordaria macrospora k-hell]